MNENILETILARMVDVTNQLEENLNKHCDFVKSLEVEGWDSEIIVENNYFVIAKIAAKKGSVMSLRKNGSSHICILKLLEESCNINVTECQEHCQDKRSLSECIKNRNNFITLRLSSDVAKECKNAIGKNYMVHITPNHCYDIEVLEDSKFLFCMLSSKV